MRALRSSPLFRIGLLSLAVLFAHTGHAATRPVVPLAPVCPEKVAAAQPDPEKKLLPAIKQIVTPGHLADWHQLFGATFGLTTTHAASLLFVSSARQITVARSTADIVPQRRQFDLRL